MRYPPSPPVTVRRAPGRLGLVASIAAWLVYRRGLASAASVAAVRESSVVIGVALGAVFLHEHVTRMRVAGAVAIAAGVAAVALG